jgi:hypothetical protein
MLKYEISYKRLDPGNLEEDWEEHQGEYPRKLRVGNRLSKIFKDLGAANGLYPGKPWSANRSTNWLSIVF